MSSVREARREARLRRLHAELKWRQWSNDIHSFISDAIFIESKRDVRGAEPLQLTEYQLDDLDAFLSERYVVILKARQLGITTLVCSFSLWRLLFQPGTRVLMLSKSQDAANDNLDKIRQMWRALPAWAAERAPRLEKDADQRMVWAFPNGQKSTITSAPITETVGAGNTYDLVVLDELALNEYQAKAYSTTYPATVAATTNPFWRGAVMIVLSTARGASNFFAGLCHDAMRGENQFRFIFHPWQVSPFMTPDDYAAQKAFWTRSGEPWMIHSEFPATPEEAFRESGSPRFRGLPDESTLEEFPHRGLIVETASGELEWQPDPAGPLRLATLEPDPDARYFIGVDPAHGLGADYTAAHLLTIDKDDLPVVVGYYHANDIRPADTARHLDAWGRFFAGATWAALMAVENQGSHGELLIHELSRVNYPNPYVYVPVARRRSTFGAQYFAFPMTEPRRVGVIDRLAHYLAPQGGTAEKPGPPLLDGIYPALRRELGSFVRQETGKGFRYAADVGCHDDLVMSLGIALWLLLEDSGSDAGGRSPAPTVDDEGTPVDRFSLRPMRERREAVIRAAEDAAREFQRNSRFM